MCGVYVLNVCFVCGMIIIRFVPMNIDFIKAKTVWLMPSQKF